MNRDLRQFITVYDVIKVFTTSLRQVYDTVFRIITSYTYIVHVITLLLLLLIQLLLLLLTILCNLVRKTGGKTSNIPNIPNGIGVTSEENIPETFRIRIRNLNTALEKRSSKH